MWFDTLILQLRLHMAYRVNGILYRLRFLRLPYENSFAKTLGLVLAVLREIFGILLGKLLYMAVFFAAPLLLIRRELPPELYGHLLVFLTLIGGIFNNNLLNGGRDAYYAVILLRMDARRYTLSAYGYYLLKTAVGFLAAALLVGHLILRQGLALCLLTPVLVCGVKLLSAGLELRHFHRRGILPRDEKRFSLLQGTSVLLLAAGGLAPLPLVSGPYTLSAGWRRLAARGAPYICYTFPAIAGYTGTCSRRTYPCSAATIPRRRPGRPRPSIRAS